jgi:drug/metabolite transporter, DME family
LSLSADILAILSALFFAVSSISMKRGLPGSNPFSAFVVDISTSAVIFGVPLVYYVATEPISLVGIAWFAASGIIGTTLGRVTQIYAIQRMGASLATTIANIFPVFSTATAVLLLGEPLTILVAAGTALMIVGLIAVSLGSESKKWSNKYLIIPLGSAAFFGAGVTMRKVGLGFIPNPLFGVAVTVYVGLISLVFYRLISKGEGGQIRLSKKNLMYFALAGVMDSLALIALFESLEFGEVTIVGPLSSAVPLFVLGLAYLFLKQVEVVHKRLIFAAFLVVIGVVLLTI